jgi:hypothetical protein
VELNIGGNKQQIKIEVKELSIRGVGAQKVGVKTQNKTR